MLNLILIEEMGWGYKNPKLENLVGLNIAVFRLFVVFLLRVGDVIPIEHHTFVMEE